MKGLLTRRFIGFLLATAAVIVRPEAAPYLAAIYGALVGAAIADTMKGPGNG